jgi:hypothetical protein
VTTMNSLVEARNFVGRFVENGTCNSTTIDARINEACRRLLVKAEWPFTTQTVRIRCDNLTFPLPRECEKIIWHNVDNTASHIRSPAYEFLSSGPGEVKHRTITSGLKDLIDMGMSATMYDIPPIETFNTDTLVTCTDRTLNTGYHIAAFSSYVEDIDKKITLYGYDRLLNEIDSSISASFVPGETLEINRWQDGEEGVIGQKLETLRLSSGLYRQLNSWIKPVTKGYILLYAVKPDVHYFWFLAKAHPDDTRPVWRRFKVSGFSLSPTCHDCSNVLALCKMAAIPLTRDADLLPIQNLDALKNMVIALGFENQNNLQSALAYEQNAVRLLMEQKQEHEVTGGVPAILDYERELMGAALNRRLI